MITPQIWSDTKLPPIWPEEEVPADLDTAEVPRPLEQLLEKYLDTGSQRRWRKITLYRYCESQDREFKLVITEGDVGQPAVSPPVTVRIYMAKASLVPQYATPDGSQPLLLFLYDGHDMHRLVFRTPEDLYLFQQALTGYEVLDNYMRYRLQVVFVKRGSGRFLENASVQIWRPKRLEGEGIMISNSSDSGSTHRASNSTHSSGGNASERAGAMSPQDAEERMSRMSLNSTASNTHFMRGARRNSNPQPTVDDEWRTAIEDINSEEFRGRVWAKWPKGTSTPDEHQHSDDTRMEYSKSSILGIGLRYSQTICNFFRARSWYPCNSELCHCPGRSNRRAVSITEPELFKENVVICILWLRPGPILAVQPTLFTQPFSPRHDQRS
ncbi:hypothetical protein B0T16DRAFT_461943 [Cercophora newfieldiana]|uniref:Uncharacterized protein n=1 Tax=Cercophora newfieldiana TaxID=92897 RepID=A0AA39XY53_9PEZI|nr:hypothetical protein B0T16DRAFT_461943 [Cercophora newfieldiana]